MKNSHYARSACSSSLAFVSRRRSLLRKEAAHPVSEANLAVDARSAGERDHRSLISCGRTPARATAVRGCGVVPAARRDIACSIRAGARHGARLRVTRARLRTVLALVVWASLAARTVTARAAPRTLVALEYDVAPTIGCSDIDEFRSNVNRQLGYDPFRPSADRRVAVQIARTENGFTGLIKWSDADGRWVGDRRLSSRRSECNEIAANVAFAVAVQIQLLATLEPEKVEPSTPETAPATPSATTPTSDTNATSVKRPEAADTSAAAPRRRSVFRFSSGVGASLGLGIAPDVTGLGRIFASGRIDWFSLELSADAALPVTQDESKGSAFKLNRFAAGAAACGHVQAFAGCLTGTFGRLQAVGYGVDQPASPTGLFSQIGARIAATQDLGNGFFVSARGDGLVMLSPWAVTLNHTLVWTTPRIGGMIGLDFGVYFF